MTSAAPVSWKIVIDSPMNIAPRPIVMTLQDAIERTVDAQPFADAGKAVGFTPAYLPADAFGRLIASEDEKIAQLMAELGLKK